MRKREGLVAAKAALHEKISSVSLVANSLNISSELLDVADGTELTTDGVDGAVDGGEITDLNDSRLHELFDIVAEGVNNSDPSLLDTIPYGIDIPGSDSFKFDPISCLGEQNAHTVMYDSNGNLSMTMSDGLITDSNMQVIGKYEIGDDKSCHYF